MALGLVGSGDSSGPGGWVLHQTAQTPNNFCIVVRTYNFKFQVQLRVSSGGGWFEGSGFGWFRGVGWFRRVGGSWIQLARGLAGSGEVGVEILSPTKNSKISKYCVEHSLLHVLS